MAASCHRISALSTDVNFNIQAKWNRRRQASESQFLPNSNQWRKGGIVLTTNNRRWLIEAVTAVQRLEEDGGEDKRKSSSTVCSYALQDKPEVVEDDNRKDVVENDDGDRRRRRKRRAEVAVAAVVTMGLGVGNRVLYKLALVPLKQYPFFLAQLATFGYVAVYFSILHFRYRAGIVTDEMLSMPKAPLLVVGLLEALGAVCGMAAGAVLSGAAIPILSQSFLVWQIILSCLFLGRKYKFNQLLGCFLVAVGVIITVASGSSAGSLMEAGMFWSLLMIVSFLFQAADTILKEVIFLDAAKRLKGGSVDLFVLNSYGSAFQALFICLLLPFLSRLWGIPFHQLPMYLSDGAACFLNMGTVSSGCEGAPLLPLLFCIVNMGYNISLLHLIKISSAVVSSLASTVSVPISVFLFTLPLPYLGVASSLPSGFIAGAVVLVMGMLIYAWTPSRPPMPSTVTTHDF
ncbi:protein CLT1, chloroplastic-like [Cynara cardunculus var. scolymus]|uniref:protein CLT1, chloroplastic-like n=1 Tax=Cynara cardunculus var. scolymus TaxID=59895 RepID=UPI000D62E076|nr:protein CLT1, chloroplastic-like [Cynara cardunculus var. scolymus]